MKTGFKLKKWAVVCSVLAAAGCAKENYVQDCADGTVFPLEISVPGLETKVLNTANEDKVNSLQVFVFRGDGLLEAYDKADKSSVTVQCTSGAKTIVAIANAPAIEDVNTRSEMESKVSALSDNAVGAFVMCGMRSESVSAASGTLSVPVTRLVARVSIQKVTNQLALNTKTIDDQVGSKAWGDKSLAGLNHVLADTLPVECGVHRVMLRSLPESGKVVLTARAEGLPVETGVFGADMAVSLVNDGPATFWLQF